MRFKFIKKQRCQFSYLVATLTLITVILLYAIKDRQELVEVALEPAQASQMNANNVVTTLKPQIIID